MSFGESLSLFLNFILGPVHTYADNFEFATFSFRIRLPSTRIPDINGKFLCEPLPSDKFNNSDKFTDSLLYHHFSIPVSTNSLLLSLLFQGDQYFSHNSARSAIVFCTPQFVHDVLLLRIRLAKYTVSWSDYEAVKRKYLMGSMPRENAMVLFCRTTSWKKAI